MSNTEFRRLKAGESGPDSPLRLPTFVTPRLGTPEDKSLGEIWEFVGKIAKNGQNNVHTPGFLGGDRKAAKELRQRSSGDTKRPLSISVFSMTFG